MRLTPRFGGVVLRSFAFDRIDVDGAEQMPSSIAKCWKLVPPLAKRFDIEIGRKHDRLIRCFCEDLALGRHDQRAAGIAQMRIGANAVDRDDKGLVLDGARDQQRSPMMLSCCRPACAEGENLRAAWLNKSAKSPKLGESKVVADQRADGRLPAGRENEAVAAAEVKGLPAVAERMDLFVDAEHFAAGRDDRSAVAALAIGSNPRESVLDEDLHALCKIDGPGQRSIIDDPVEVHAEAGVAQLWQQNERAGLDSTRAQHPLNLRVIGGLVLPGDVKLNRCKPHRTIVS